MSRLGRQRFVEPLAISGVEDPFRFLADAVDVAALLLSGHLDPAGLPRQIVNRMPLRPVMPDRRAAESSSQSP